MTATARSLRARTLPIAVPGRLKRHLPIAGALALAVIGTLGVLQAGHRPAPTGPLTYVLTDAVPAGTPVRALSRHLALVAVPAAARPADALDDLAGIRGLTVTRDKVAGEPLRRADLADPTVAPRPGTAGTPVPAGAVELTVSLAPERALAGNLHAGDQVLVLVTDPTGTAPATTLGPPLTVTGVQGATDKAVAGPALVTFALDPALAPALSAAAARSAVWLASVHSTGVTP